MTNALATLTEQFKPLFPRLEESLAGAIPVEKMVQTVMVSCEANPGLLECNRQTLFSATLGACMLRLPVDGVTGQAYLVPFKKRVQLLPGYQGLITLAARSTFVCHADLVRERDNFKMTSGSNPGIDHTYGQGQKTDRGAVVAAYAVFRSKHFPDVLKVMDRAELNEVNSGRNVWKSNPEAMMLKTPIRRAAKLLPMDTAQDLGLALALEEQHDLGHHAEITPERVVSVDRGVSVEDTPQNVSERLTETTTATPYSLDVCESGVDIIQFQTPDKFVAGFLQELETCTDWESLFNANSEALKRLRGDAPELAATLEMEYKKCKSRQS